MINSAVWEKLEIIGRHDYDENDPDSRGPFVVLGAPGVVDGNVMDVYGETLEEACANAEIILSACARAALKAARKSDDGEIDYEELARNGF